MAILTINIKGMALIDMGHSWNIYMPFDPTCHRVKLVLPGIPQPKTIELADCEQHVTISVSSSSPRPIPIPDPNSFSTFFDISHPKAHKDGVLLRKKWFERTVLLTIPGGVYSAFTTPNTYTLLDGNGKPVLPLGNIGTSGTVKIQGDEVVLDAIGIDPITFKQDTTIEIDNDCPPHPHSQNNDFDMLYQFVIRDKTDEKIQFRVKADGAGPPLPCNNYRTSLKLEVEP